MSMKAKTMHSKSVLFNVALALATSVSIISVATPLAVQATESNAHRAYDNELRRQIVEVWRQNNWKSSCFVAENGLRSLIKISFNNQNGEYWLLAKKQYFLDANCNQYAEMQEDVYEKLNPTDFNISFFHLGADPRSTIEYKSDGFFIQFGTQSVSFFIDKSAG